MTEAKKENFVQRILSKIVGEEISAEELKLISGGLKDSCDSNCKTWEAGNYTFADCNC